MRGKLIVLGVVVALVSMMTAADAGVGAGTGTTPVNCRSTTFEKIPVSGVNQFRTLGGLETGISAIYPVTVTVSLVVQGKPAKIKVQDTYISQKDVASPGVITLQAGPRQGDTVHVHLPRHRRLRSPAGAHLQGQVEARDAARGSRRSSRAP